MHPSRSAGSSEPSHPRTRPRVAVLLAHDLDVERWRSRYESGEVLDATPYGYHRAAAWFDLAWSRGYPESRLRRRVRVGVSRSLGFDLIHAWRNRALLRSADAVWTHTEREHLAVAVIQRLTPWRARVPVLAQTVWLWDEWPSFGRGRRTGLAVLLRTHTVEAVHSSVNRGDSIAAVPNRSVVLVPFGTSSAVGMSSDQPSESAWPTVPARTVAGRVLAVGNDRDRDWRLVAQVAEARPELQFWVASRSRAVQAISWPSNVHVESVSRREDLGDLYRSADVVVVALRPNRHASGTTALIEALASGCRVVFTDTGGLGDYAGDTATPVPPGDADALAGALDEALVNGEHRPPGVVAERGLTQEDYVSRYVLITRWLLGEQPLGPEVSDFRSVDLFTSPE